MNKRGFTIVPQADMKFVKSEVARLAKELQARRKERGFTQESLAEKLDVSVGTIKTIEQGLRMPSIPMLIMIARILRLKIGFF